MQMHLMSSASLCFGFHYEGGIAYQKYPLSFVYYFLMSIGYSRYILSIVTNQQYTSIVWLLLFQGPTSNREIKFIFTRKSFYYIGCTTHAYLIKSVTSINRKDILQRLLSSEVEIHIFL